MQNTCTYLTVIWCSLKFSLKFDYCSVNGSTTARSLFLHMESPQSIQIPQSLQSIINWIASNIQPRVEGKRLHRKHLYPTAGPFTSKGLLIQRHMGHSTDIFCKHQRPSLWRLTVRIQLSVKMPLCPGDGEIKIKLKCYGCATMSCEIP